LAGLRDQPAGWLDELPTIRYFDPFGPLGTFDLIALLLRTIIK
jgi:hypothetical protein